MPLATLHHLACTGGTVISKCLAAMDGAYVVSEVHPHVTTPLHFEPMAPGMQFQAQYGRLAPGEMDRMFMAQVSVLDRRARQDGKVLLLRDHAHSDFTNPAGAGRPILSDLLAKRLGERPPWAATLRDPVETYLSLYALNWHYGQSFETYCKGWLAFADAYAEAPSFYYEDFCAEPSLVLLGLCDALGLTFDPEFHTRLGERVLTGDSGRSAAVVEARPWRPVSADLLDEARTSPAYARILERWPRYRRELELKRDKPGTVLPRGRPVAAFSPSRPATLDSSQEVPMTEITPRLGLPIIAAGQAQKHVTHNEALMVLDSLVQGMARSRTLTTEPVLALDGDAYILPPGRTGPSWSLMPVGDLAVVRDGTWTTLSPPEGTVLFVLDEALQAVRGADGWRSVISPPWGEGRNRLVNGAMDLWTRGASTEVTGPGWAFQADRWRVYASDGWACTYARESLLSSAGTPPARYAARLDISPGDPGGFVQIYQSLEGVGMIADGTATVSAYVKSSGPVQVDALLWRDFGIDGSPSYAIFAEPKAATGEWQRMIWHLPVPDLVGAVIGDDSALGVILRVQAAAAVRLDVSCIQAEAGDVATPFERRSPALEAVMARRYFRRSAQPLSTADLAYEMRKTPVESGDGPYDYDAEL
ncbi:MAG: DUF2793 domain-containing protein [Caulobacterales bacterium]|nr:DUF2793 domain-containing protein [Caulobacterales bacterium]